MMPAARFATSRCCALVASILSIHAVLANTAAPPTVDDDGTLHVRGESIPYSDLASAEARRNFVEFTRAFERATREIKKKNVKSGAGLREVVDRMLIIPGLEHLRKAFPVRIAPLMIAGVQTDVIVPASAIAPRNQYRVLINLHGGGMQVGGRYGGQMESVPIASIGAVKIIAVDYRMAPEWHFPAASEDVAKVYNELLKSYRPENIGIFGCSSGALLAGESIVWFHDHGLPVPGAIGMFGEGLFLGSFGDSNYIFTGGKPAVTPEEEAQDPYFSGVDLKDPLVSPGYNASALALFPPSLLISGTRDIGLSQIVYTHSRLVALGVKADLHIWDGAPHCSYAQPIVDPTVPETRQAWSVITKFFDEHLGINPM